MAPWMLLEIIMNNSRLRLVEAAILKSLAIIQTQASSSTSKTSLSQCKVDHYQIWIVAHPRPTNQDPINHRIVYTVEEMVALVATLTQQIWALSWSVINRIHISSTQAVLQTTAQVSPSPIIGSRRISILRARAPWIIMGSRLYSVEGSIRGWIADPQRISPLSNCMHRLAARPLLSFIDCSIIMNRRHN